MKKEDITFKEYLRQFTLFKNKEAVYSLLTATGIALVIVSAILSCYYSLWWLLLLIAIVPIGLYCEYLEDYKLEDKGGY